jgi:membrane-bound ClpP family serine protease
MTVVAAILVALVLAYLAFRFVKGMIKFALLAVIVLVAYLVGHQAGAF